MRGKLDDLPIQEWVHTENGEGNMSDAIVDEREGAFFLKVGGAF
ncbi:hypothetical protein [Burkholderia reimsis]|nr:hypothetical protein [Burkholderia reimsis]